MFSVFCLGFLAFCLGLLAGWLVGGLFFVLWLWSQDLKSRP